jgi:hypothetical protein
MEMNNIAATATAIPIAQNVAFHPATIHSIVTNDTINPININQPNAFFITLFFKILPKIRPFSRAKYLVNEKE